ncbi:MAG: putative diguanylate cyclase, domain [Armatimonadetes bacterium]|jgi:diguanylate cyclase (GGDEF)-like protein|nr:putative diguanylate cyclase, domain [Armatimonadota bacterium]
MLDPRTLLVGYSITTLILSLAILLAARSQRRFAGLELWSFAGLLIGIVPLQIAANGLTAAAPTSLVVQLTILAGTLFMRAGFSAYTERPLPWRRYLAFCVVWLPCEVLLQHATAPLGWRVGLLGVSVAVISVDAGMQLVKSPQLWELPAHRATARLLFVLAAGVGLRAVSLVVMARPVGQIGAALINPYGLLLFQGLHASIGVSLLMMVWSRLDRELQAHVDHLEDEIVRDPLTGALNRRGLLRAAETELAGELRHEGPVSLICLDIDHFKAVNDTHGHDAGDAVLRILMATIQPHLRPGDRIARLGGEEFAVFLPGTGLEAALAVAERLRRSVEETSVSLADGMLRFTCSFGVAERLRADEGLPPILTRADHALYRAKHLGRNRVCAAEAGVVALRRRADRSPVPEAAAARDDS